MMGMAGGMGVMNQMSGYDALYIGDLQWVCGFDTTERITALYLFVSSAILYLTVDNGRGPPASRIERRCYDRS
jgi:hypothetical protein